MAYGLLIVLLIVWSFILYRKYKFGERPTLRKQIDPRVKIKRAAIAIITFLTLSIILIEQTKPVNYYELLEVSAGASASEIKTKYRQMTLLHHPDKGGESAYFMKVKTAHDTLKEPKTRILYDQFGPIVQEHCSTKNCTERNDYLFIYYMTILPELLSMLTITLILLLDRRSREYIMINIVLLFIVLGIEFTSVSSDKTDFSKYEQNRESSIDMYPDFELHRLMRQTYIVCALTSLIYALIVFDRRSEREILLDIEQIVQQILENNENNLPLKSSKRSQQQSLQQDSSADVLKNVAATISNAKSKLT